MFGIEDIQRAQLQSSIGNNQSSSPEDVINTRAKFATLGRHSEDTNRPYIDRELDQSIRNFQGDKGLKQDGIMHPGGETDRSLNRNLSRLEELGAPEIQPLSRLAELSAPVGDGQENRETDVQNVQRSLGEIGLLSEKKMTEPNGIVDRETLDGIREFQGQNNLRIDGKINPDGETNRAINSLADLQAVQKQRAAEGDAESENLPLESRPLDGDDDEEESDCAAQELAVENAQIALANAEVNLRKAEEKLEPKEAELKTKEENLELKKNEKTKKEEELKETEEEIRRREQETEDAAADAGGFVGGVAGGLSSAIGAFGVTKNPGATAGSAVIGGLAGHNKGRDLGRRMAVFLDKLTTSQLEKRAKDLKVQIEKIQVEIQKLQAVIAGLKTVVEQLRAIVIAAESAVTEAEIRLTEAENALETCQAA